MPANSRLQRIAIPDKTTRYVAEVVDPLLQDLVCALIRDQPVDAVQYLSEYFLRHGDIRTIHEADVFSGEEPDSDTNISASEDNQSNEPVMNANYMRSRAAVSAEVYGDWNKRREFTAPSFPKSNEERLTIERLISHSFLFNHLESSEMAIVIDAFQLVNVPPDNDVISEGDVGDFLCVVETGTLACLKESLVVRECGPGDVFGELSLLYSTPRAATVRTITNCKLWRLDSEPFKRIVQEASTKKRERYAEFLRKVQLLENLSTYELSQIADALTPKEFTSREVIVYEGDRGDKFFIVEKGSADAFKQDEHVFNYSNPGDYFGELSLLRDEPRAATVRAGADGCRLLVLDRSAFERLIGSMEFKLNQRHYN